MKQKPLRDETLYCAHCGISFLYTVEEQRQAGAEHDAGTQNGISGGISDGTRDVAPTLCPACTLLLPDVGRERGMVKWYNIRKRYGFVVREGKPDLFVPATSLQGQRFLQPGDLVEFTLGQNNEGPIAKEVHVLVSAQPEARA